MPRRMMDAVLQVVQHLKNLGIDMEKVPLAVVLRTIRERCGGRDETVRRYKDYMYDFGWMKDVEVTDNGKVVSLNINKLYEVML